MNPLDGYGFNMGATSGMYQYYIKVHTNHTIHPQDNKCGPLLDLADALWVLLAWLCFRLCPQSTTPLVDG